MSLDQIVAFLLFSVVAAITPGPSNVMLTAAGANAGVVRGIPCLLGVVLGMGLMLFLVPLGLGSVVLGDPLALRVLNWGGAAFLLWLAWKIATARPGAEGEKPAPVGFAGAALFQWANPKSWLVAVSAAGTYLDAESGGALPQAAWLGGLFALAALPSCLVWLAIGAGLQRVLANDRRMRIFNRVMGALLAASVALIVL